MCFCQRPLTCHLVLEELLKPPQLPTQGPGMSSSGPTPMRPGRRRVPYLFPGISSQRPLVSSPSLFSFQKTYPRPLQT